MRTALRMDSNEATDFTEPVVSSTRPQATARDHVWVVAAAAVLMLGVIVDGWAHTNIIEELEGFITPWHGVIFTGYVLTVLALTRIVVRGVGEGRTIRMAIPAGYLPAVLGAAGFAVGFTGDGIWHTIYGIEADVDALLSPTHLLMFGSVLTMLSGPICSSWDSAGGRTTTLRRFGPVLAATTVGTVMVAFFLIYAWGTASPGPASSFAEFVGSFDREFLIEIAEGWGLLSIYATTIVLVAPLLHLSRRWDLPFGTATVVFSSVSILLAAVREFRYAAAIPAVVAAGVVADLIIRHLRPAPDRPAAARVVGVAVPVVLWTGYLGVFAAMYGLGWEAELVAGSVVFSAAIGYGLAALAFPRTVTPTV